MCHSNITREDALSERLFQGTISALELLSVYLGSELKLYQVLREYGPRTYPELAKDAGIHERYAREWLEQQAVAGFLNVDDCSTSPSSRRYALPEAHQGVLANAEHSAHLAPFAQMLVGIAGALPDVVQAYRTGDGVPYARYGRDFRRGQGGINRPAFSHDLVNNWFGALPDVERRLQNGEALSVIDVGAGEGWASIALARAFPNARVVGFDLDQASVTAARDNAARAGVNVEFVLGDASSISDFEPFDLILLLETLHDISHPVRALRQLKGILKRDGTLLIADERVAADFVAPGDAIERMMYGWSVSHCLPVSMAEAGSSAIGTAIRPSTVIALSQEAGFGRAEVLGIENDLFRFYRLGH